MASITCGKCEGTHDSVAAVRSCHGALPTATVVEENEGVHVERRGENFFLTTQAQGLYDQHQMDLAEEEANPQRVNFPPALRRGARIDLNVQFSEKEHAKSFGARWDPKNKTWYYEGSELPEGLRRYDPAANKPAREPRPLPSTSDLIKGVSGSSSMSSSSEQSFRDHMNRSEGTSQTVVMETPTETKHTFDPKPTVDDGFYKHNDVIFKVQWNLEGSGKYAKKLVVRDGEGHWEFAGGALRFLTEEHALTLDEAKEFGKLYGVCCRCGRTLTNEASIDAGIGPICAGKF